MIMVSFDVDFCDCTVDVDVAAGCTLANICCVGARINVFGCNSDWDLVC